MSNKSLCGLKALVTATDVTDLATCACSGALGLSGNSKHPLKRALNGHLKCRHSLVGSSLFWS